MAGEVPFALPVPFKVLRRSNLREGPSSAFKVLFTLKKGVSVIGHSHKGQWVRVISMDGRSGWIFHTFLEGRYSPGFFNCNVFRELHLILLSKYPHHFISIKVWDRFISLGGHHSY